ncbi:hypothetical protein HJC23_003976 [Cyclotella cryptica]|uniref:Phosphoglucomutase n=1 Tax=Cyclotella cryptica TaxID=29204 RepID=A0ABD3QTV7_9STRA|eukprot:CCRYP_001953-RA/>CCRYP_001953-RA protein AED:0.02 eAED:0.02 QI:390/1/1/1/1/1/2/210/632
MTVTDTSLLDQAKQWLSIDPNPTTKRHIEKLVSSLESCDNSSDSAAARLELASLFSKRIGFGTAGLRGRMQPGPSGMNDLVVVQTAQGLASYLKRIGAANGGVVLKAAVGYDHRAESAFHLSSKQFAMYTKLVFQEAGIECVLLDGFVATPLLAFSVTALSAAVGIMVTASHNPKNDNGYKVYWKNGCQIIPPVDEEISATILEDSNLTPWCDYGERLRRFKDAQDPEVSVPCGECHGLSDVALTQEMEDRYFSTIQYSGLVSTDFFSKDDSSLPKFAYSAMHGVGHPYAKRSFHTFHLPPFHGVTSQCDPNPEFPTVPFPNPEEKGALNEAMDYAVENGCDVVLANDPDADRLGVAEYSGEGRKWTVFTGDQIGTLLGVWLWETVGKNSDKPIAMCASTVSSKMLGTIGKQEGFLFEETLTGFKWIGSRALSLKEQGYKVLLGYEEAIGFSCGEIIPDKDGISALGVIATMACHLYSRGKTLAVKLQEIYDNYGEFVCNNGYYRCDDPAVVMNIMEQMRNNGKYFERVGSYQVESIRDLGFPGYDSTTKDKKPLLPTSTSSPMITFRFTNGCVAQFRASGTEPKFKYYIELRGNPGERKDDVEKRLHEMSCVLLEELLNPTQNGLVIPSSL